MARRKEKIVRTVIERGRPGKRWHHDIDPHTKKSMTAVLFFVCAIIALLAYWGHAGVFGAYLFRMLSFLVGKAYFLAPLTFVLLAFSFLFSIQRKRSIATFIGGGLFLFSSLALVDLLFHDHAGGIIGYALDAPLFQIVDFWASLVIEAGLLIVGLLMMMNLSFLRRAEEGDTEKGLEKETGAEALLEGAKAGIAALAEKMKRGVTDAEGPVPPERESIAVAASAPASIPLKPEAKTAEDMEFNIRARKIRSQYEHPPLSLLQDDRGTPSSGDIRANANIIRRTLQNFGIDVEMGEVSVGPTVTQYTLKPAEGVKLARILALQKELALALAAHPIRVEAPIPGKSLVGIEVPNRSIALVGLRSLFENPAFTDAAAPLVFALGRDVTGAPMYANLGKMPHLLVAGSTGSGKSVSLHSIIMSLLYRNPPEMLKLLIVDPKRVELSIYSGIPHLLTPPITDPKKTIAALRWAVKEMEKRYETLSAVGARDIAGYNAAMAGKKGKDEEADIMPYLVIVIDELADLMMSFPREVEGSIVRLAQMARAVGIHLIVSTQRPSVEVITGLIKANITSRVALQVSSQIDSRTILDMAGAEKLLGNGDMLFLAGDTAKPKRIQGGFVSDGEVKKVVQFLQNQIEGDAASGEEIFAAAHNGGASDFDEYADDAEDPLYEEARELVIAVQKASASYLQRRLKVGYARAARLLDILEERGIIGPGDGAKPRDVLVKNDDMTEAV